MLWLREAIWQGKNDSFLIGGTPQMTWLASMCNGLIGHRASHKHHNMYSRGRNRVGIGWRLFGPANLAHSGAAKANSQYPATSAEMVPHSYFLMEAPLSIPGIVTAI